MKRFLLLSILAASTAQAQDRQDAATYEVPPTNEFYENVRKKNEEFFKKKEEPRKRLTMDFSGLDAPGSIKEFRVVTADKPVSQGITGTCWCFSTTSFYESEARRLTGKELQLSELFTVYWEYVEKAREYVRTRGASLFDEGSETNAVQRTMAKYGAVPLEAYTGMKPGQPYHDHSKMVAEMRTYLEGVKARAAWNEDEVAETIRHILDHHMGTPPTEVKVGGRKMTPKEYLRDVVKFKPSDYVTFMSLKSEPYLREAEYKVPDNWWHSKDYYNVPLAEFMSLIKGALRAGYSISIGGDVSESGIDSKLGLMAVPSYDIPSSFINEDARLLRFLNGATTDDHAMHLIGFAERTSGMWFLIKDSGAGGHANAEHSGYWYAHEDYVKLKMMTATVHKAAVKDLMQRIAVR